MSAQDKLTQVIAQLINNLSDNKVAASNGCKYLGIASFSTESFTSLYIREDTTITALAGVDAAGTAIDFLTTFAISGITLKAGDLYIAPNGCRIVSGTLTGGSAIGYR